LTFEVLAVSWG